MDKSTALDKIKKCLRLAKSSNPHEAAAALRQAKALMREHGIGETDVAASEANEQHARSGATSRPPSWEIYLADMIAECFGCEIVFRAEWRTRRRGQYAFVGVGCYPEIAAYAFAVLLRQVRKARAAHITARLRRCRSAGKTRRADEFCRGWVCAAEPKVEALVPTQKDERVISAYLAVHYPNAVTKPGIHRRAGLSADRFEGYIAGAGAVLDHGVAGVARTPSLESRPCPQ